jgi:hypothetical protein
MRETKYVQAGRPTQCQRCEKPFEGFCIRGEGDRYSEVCAQVGLKIDFEKGGAVPQRPLDSRLLSAEQK